MKQYRLEDMTKGWFVGAFAPTVIDTTDCEVAIKHYTAGDYEPTHHHKIAAEVTAIVSGTAAMCGREWGPGSIVLIEPGEATDFRALTDVVTVVVKMPSVAGDKYQGAPEAA